MKKTSIVLGAIALSGLVSCGNNAGNEKKAETQAEPKKQVVEAFSLSNLDKSYDPCSDFYQYAIGSWLKDNPIPSTESRWGVFENLAEDNRNKLNNLIEDITSKSDYKKGSDEQLVRDFYLSALDSTTCNTLGIKPLKPYLQKINSISSKEELHAYMIDAYKKGLGGTFGFWIGSDSKNSNENVLQLSQGSGGLPDRDYYLSDNEKMVAIRKAYMVHLEKMFMLIGESESEAKASAQTVFNLEKKLAEISMTRLDRRDPLKTYNPKSVQELHTIAPEFDWAKYFNEFGISNPEKIIVGQPGYMTGYSKLFKGEDLSTWKKFFEWELVNSMANYLNKEIVDQNFDFYSRTLNGVQTMKPRWKRAQGMLNGNFGETLGKIYVSKYFSEDAKKSVGQLIENLRAAFRVRIENLDWMSDETKASAKQKLESFTYKIGYPDTWNDFSSIGVSENTLFENIIAVNEFSLNKMLKDYGQPVDKTRWWMNPQTINAYYNPLFNEVVFPAAILQPPFYNVDADDAINYGSIGAVIGHEFTHGFDDKGCLYNHEGNLENWWQETDFSKFNTRAKVIVDQFNQYKPLPDLSVDGELTLGENIADFGGLTMAYYALEKALEGKPKPQDIDGFTYKQRIFLGWANVWKNNIKDEALRNRILNDTHSPGEFRVNGTVSNMPEFQEAWGCKEGDAMYRKPEDRAKIW